MISKRRELGKGQLGRLIVIDLADVWNIELVHSRRRPAFLCQNDSMKWNMILKWWLHDNDISKTGDRCSLNSIGFWMMMHTYPPAILLKWFILIITMHKSFAYH